MMLKNYLDEDDVKMSIHYALQKRDLYTNLAYRIGHETSSITEYEKVTMITVPISSSELFLVSTEPRADYLKIIDAVRSTWSVLVINLTRRITVTMDDELVKKSIPSIKRNCKISKNMLVSPPSSILN